MCVLMEITQYLTQKPTGANKKARSELGAGF